MRQLVKQHKIISIPQACPMFSLVNFTVALVGTNIEKCEMKFVIEKISPPYLRNNTVETVYKFKKG